MSDEVIELAKYTRRVYQNSTGTYGVSIPKEIGDSLKSRDVEVRLLNNGDIIIRPIIKDE